MQEERGRHFAPALDALLSALPEAEAVPAARTAGPQLEAARA